MYCSLIVIVSLLLLMLLLVGIGWLYRNRCTPVSLVNYLRGDVTHFLHVGKCGGTSLMKIFPEFKEYHVRSIPWQWLKEQERIVIWIREPFARLRSAFYFSQDVYHSTAKHVDLGHRIMALGSRRCSRLASCYARFNTFAQWAEAMAINDTNALYLWKNDTEHLFRGLTHYFPKDGTLQIKSLFVGCLETFQEDLDLLCLHYLRCPKRAMVTERQSPPKNPDVLSEQAEQVIRDILKNEYAVYNKLLDYRARYMSQAL